MKPKKLGLVHTSAAIVPVFQKLCAAELKGVDVFNIVDDSLIKDVMARGELTAKTSRRVVDHIASAESAGADVILVTCSSIGRAVEAAAHLMSVPVLRVDQAMADLAVQTGPRVGVLATLPTTLEPTSDLIRRRAALEGRSVEITSILCEGAFDALISGDAARHDQLLGVALKDLSARVDVIVLAQASMARVVETLSAAAQRVPILASPPIAVRHLAKLFAADT